MDLAQVRTYLSGLKFCGCGINRKDHYLFLAMQFEGKDPLELREAGVFVARKPNGSKFDWAYRKLGRGTGVRLCHSEHPKAQWLFIFDDGAVHALGSGEEGSEQAIADPRRTNITCATKLPSGNVVVCGTSREVFLRRGKGIWDQELVGPSTDVAANWIDR